MKIVQINTVYDRGSVGRITANLYKTIENKGYQAAVAYGRGKKLSNSNSYKISNVVDFTTHVLKNFFQDGSGFGSKIATKKLVKWLQIENPDVIQLHNLHGFYLNIEIFFEFLKKSEIPVVWTLHDCWTLTGHCAFFDYVQCEKWKEGCHNCSQYRVAYPYALFKDNSANNYKRKRDIFTGVKNLTIVTPSRWLKELVEKSILKEYPVKVIANGIDISNFSPKIRKRDDEQLKTDENNGQLDNFTILGVANVWEKRKGLEFFELLGKELPDNYRIILIGLNKRQQRNIQKKFLETRVLPLMRTESVEELANYYRQADVFVNPTLEDNFPTTNIEALACGTPVVTFQTGGSGEALNQMAGLVVKKGDKTKLIEGILEVCHCLSENQLTKAQNKRFSSSTCRDRANLFNQDDVFEEYLSLYNKIKH